MSPHDETATGLALENSGLTPGPTGDPTPGPTRGIAVDATGGMTGDIASNITAAPTTGTTDVISGGTPSQAILTCHDLVVGYGNTPVRRVPDLIIPRGLSTVITGPNGSGKTTLALTLAGLLPPLEGQVEASDDLAPGHRHQPHTWKSKELLSRIGTVFQSPDHQFVAATVFDEIAVGLRALKTSPHVIEQQVTALLEQLYLAHLARANPFTLSGGEKRRLSVATVLAGGPQLVVLDEPTFGQDRRTWLGLVEIVTDLRDQGKTIVSVTHDQAYIDALGDHRIDLGVL